MSAREGRRDPHLAVKREVLVRYLDAWTPVALRSQRGATYVESGAAEFVVDAFRVFGESADRMDDGHHLDMVLVGTAVELGERPEGLTVRTLTDPADLKVTGPVLAHLDAVAEADAWRLVDQLGKGKGREVLLSLPAVEQAADYCDRLHDKGLTCTVAVELVDDDGHAELLLFATADSKHLAIFKNELWAADEFAGIRYRDPHDTEHALVDISLTPQLLPLRRVLLAELARRGPTTVADLQQHTLMETIYRPADAVNALTSAAAKGAITKEPEKGRLTPKTIVSAA